MGNGRESMAKNIAKSYSNPNGSLLREIYALGTKELRVTGARRSCSFDKCLEVLIFVDDEHS